jgi:hypothetical protein
MNVSRFFGLGWVLAMRDGRWGDPASRLIRATDVICYGLTLGVVTDSGIGVRPTLTVSLLIAVVTLCPILCRTIEVVHASPQDRATRTSSDAPRPPSVLLNATDDCCRSKHDGQTPIGGGNCCSGGDDTCLCSGTVKGSDAQVPDFRGVGTSYPSDGHLDAGRPTHRHVLVHLNSAGQPVGLAWLGDALTVRAFLQNFRF